MLLVLKRMIGSNGTVYRISDPRIGNEVGPERVVAVFMGDQPSCTARDALGGFGKQEDAVFCHRSLSSILFQIKKGKAQLILRSTIDGLGSKDVIKRFIPRNGNNQSRLGRKWISSDTCSDLRVRLVVHVVTISIKNRFSIPITNNGTTFGGIHGTVAEGFRWIGSEVDAGMVAKIPDVPSLVLQAIFLHIHPCIGRATGCIGHDHIVIPR